MSVTEDTGRDRVSQLAQAMVPVWKAWLKWRGREREGRMVEWMPGWCLLLATFRTKEKVRKLFLNREIRLDSGDKKQCVL